MTNKEKCNICRKDINLKKDDYVKVIDYKEGKFFMDGYYHNPCWHNAMHKKTLEAVEGKMKERLGGILGMLGR